MIKNIVKLYLVGFILGALSLYSCCDEEEGKEVIISETYPTGIVVKKNGTLIIEEKSDLCRMNSAYSLVYSSNSFVYSTSFSFSGSDFVNNSDSLGNVSLKLTVNIFDNDNGLSTTNSIDFNHYISLGSSNSLFKIDYRQQGKDYSNAILNKLQENTNYRYLDYNKTVSISTGERVLAGCIDNWPVVEVFAGYSGFLYTNDMKDSIFFEVEQFDVHLWEDI